MHDFTLISIKSSLLLTVVLGLLLSQGMGASPQASRRVFKDLPYFKGPGSEPGFHTLDLYLPEGDSNRPVIFFIHGGAWKEGDKADPDLEPFLEWGVTHGFAVATVNYRLSPAFRHPAHIQDVARSFSWLHKAAPTYGLARENFFVVGHSAGGHLAALLALEPSHLESEGLSVRDIRGVVAISGIYDMSNRRGPGVDPVIRDQAFGEDREMLKDASPADKVATAGSETPPFLITYTSEDLFGFDEQAKAFYGQLLARRRPSHLVQVPHRTHFNVLPSIARPLERKNRNGYPIVAVEDLLGPAVLWFTEAVMDGSFVRNFRAVWPEGGPGAVPGLKEPAMKVVRDVRYHDGPGSDPRLNTLDLYLPEGKSAFPVLLDVHGGRWRVGDKDYPEPLVHLLGRLGWGVISINYRLSPGVRHPAHVQDAAKALAWVYRNGPEYGVDRERIVITGHSAGGHLVSLLALDQTYLNAEGLTEEVVKGVVSTSGIYNLPEWAEPGQVPTGVEQAFGPDERVLREASPIHHLQDGAPPFLITFTDQDLYLLPEQAQEFYSLFLKNGLQARLVQIPDRPHCCPTNYITGLGGPPINLVHDVLAVELVSFLSRVAGVTDELKAAAGL